MHTLLTFIRRTIHTMPKHRQEKVAHELLRVLATALLQDVKDPRLSAVTLTGAHVSADLQIAHINWLCDKNLERENITTGLQKATPFLRSCIGEKMALRRVPALIFHYDDAYETGEHMSRLLAQLRENGEMGSEN